MKWQASQSSVLCSEHFRREDFVCSANLGDGQNLDIAKRWLRTDDFGVCVFPSVHAKTLVPNPNDKPASNRAKRMVRCVIPKFVYCCLSPEFLTLHYITKTELLCFGPLGRQSHDRTMQNNKALKNRHVQELVLPAPRMKRQ